MAIWGKIFGITEAGLDLALLLTNIERLRTTVAQTINSLPSDVQAKIKKKANFRCFAQAMDHLTIKERDAIEDILAELRPKQAKQERFILQSVLTGPELKDTVLFLQRLAEKSTPETIQYLEDLDYTQEPTTLGWFQIIVRKAPQAIVDTFNEFSADFEKTGLPATAKDLRDKAKAWAGF
jgi:hypothetical protein